MKKTLAIISVCLLSIAVLFIIATGNFIKSTGIFASPEEKVKLKADEYSQNYKTVSLENNNDVIYGVFIDKEYKFQYSITAKKEPVKIDGSSFGSFYDYQTDFFDKYFEYIIKGANRANQNTQIKLYGNQFARGNTDNIYIQVNKPLVYDKFLYEDISNLGRNFIKLDTRAHFKADVSEKVIPIKDSSNEIVLYYNGTTNKIISTVEKTAIYYMDCMELYTGKRPEYLRYEHKDFKEVPGIDKKIPVERITDDDFITDGVDMYYFKLRGKEYFITNYYVYQTEMQNDIGLFYNSYTDVQRKV